MGSKATRLWISCIPCKYMNQIRMIPLYHEITLGLCAARKIIRATHQAKIIQISASIKKMI